MLGFSHAVVARTWQICTLLGSEQGVLARDFDRFDRLFRRFVTVFERLRDVLRPISATLTGELAFL